MDSEVVGWPFDSGFGYLEKFPELMQCVRSDRTYYNILSPVLCSPDF